MATSESDVKYLIEAALKRERHRIAAALRARLSNVGGASQAVLREVVEAVESGGGE